MGLVDLTEQFKFLKNFILIFEGTFWRSCHPQVSLVNPIPVSSIHGAASLWPLDAGRAGEGERSPEVNNFPSFGLESAPSSTGHRVLQHPQRAGSILCQQPAGKPGTIPHREQPWHSPRGCPCSVFPSLSAHRADKSQGIFLQPSSILECGRATISPHGPQCDHPGKLNCPKMLQPP